MSVNYLVPAGTVNNRTAYFYADSTKQFGPIVKKIADQILVIIDYTTVLSGTPITAYKFTSDVESNPPLYVTDPLISSTGNILSFLVSGGIDGQQYNITVGLNPVGLPPTVTVLRNDVLTINMPSKSACDVAIPPMVTLLTPNSIIACCRRLYWGPVAPTGQFVLDQWFNTSSGILYEWITDGDSYFWEEIGAGGPTGGGGSGGLIDAPLDGILYSRRNGLWIADPIQVDAPGDGKIYVRNNDNWIPDPLQIDAPADGQVWGRKDNQWAPSVGGGGGGGITDAPSDGNTYARRNGTWVIPKVGIAFVYSGMPPSNQVINIPITFGINVPSSLNGVQTYVSTLSTSNAIFTLNKISGGSTTAIGTITINSGSHTTTSLSGSGGTLAIGDVLQMVAPSIQDTTLADVGITILVTRG